MELRLSHRLVNRLTDIERTIASFPRTADHKQFYKKRIADNKLKDVMILGQSMELTLTKEDAEEIQKKANQGIVQQHFRLIKNSLEVIRYARSVRFGTLNATVLQQENKILSDGFSDFWEEGKIRAPHEKPTYAKDGLRHRVQEPDYNLWLDMRQILSNLDTEIHPIGLAATMAYHLAYSYPFLQFSLQTALLGAYTVIRPTRYWEKGILAIMPSIWDTLQRTDFSSPPSEDGLTLFAERVATDFRSQAVTILDSLEHQATIQPHIRASLNDRQLKILTYFKQHKKITRKKYAKMMDIAIATAFRDLNDLYQKGLIKPVGRGRGVAYILAKLPTFEELQHTQKQEEKVIVPKDPFAQATQVNGIIDDDLFVE